MIRLILVFTICSSAVLCNPPNFFKENDITRFFCKQKIQFSIFHPTFIQIETVWLSTLHMIIVSSKLSCGGTSRLKKISLRNPSSIVNECRYTIKPSNLRVCQVRSDVSLHHFQFVYQSIWNKFAAEDRFRYGFGPTTFKRQSELSEMSGRCVSCQ